MIHTDGTPTIAWRDIDDATEVNHVLDRIADLTRYEIRDLHTMGLCRKRTLDYARKLEDRQNELSKVLGDIAYRETA